MDNLEVIRVRAGYAFSLHVGIRISPMYLLSSWIPATSVRQNIATYFILPFILLSLKFRILTHMIELLVPKLSESNQHFGANYRESVIVLLTYHSEVKNIPHQQCLCL